MKFNIFKIKKLMADKNLTNKKLAELMGVSPQWLGVVLKRGYATFNYVNKLSKALKVKIEDIGEIEDLI